MSALSNVDEVGRRLRLGQSCKGKPNPPSLRTPHTRVREPFVLCLGQRERRA